MKHENVNILFQFQLYISKVDFAMQSILFYIESITLLPQAVPQNTSSVQQESLIQQESSVQQESLLQQENLVQQEQLRMLLPAHKIIQKRLAELFTSANSVVEKPAKTVLNAVVPAKTRSNTDPAINGGKPYLKVFYC